MALPEKHELRPDLLYPKKLPRFEDFTARGEREGLSGLVKSWSCKSFAFMPISLHCFPPPCEGGVRGGGPGTTSHKVFPRSLPYSPFASLSRGEKNRSRCPRLPQHPPYPPFARGGFNGAPFARGGKGSLAGDVIPSRATKTRVSKSSLQLGHRRLFAGRARGTLLTCKEKQNGCESA